MMTQIKKICWLSVLLSLTARAGLLFSLVVFPAQAELAGFFETFDYGSENQNNIPVWFDQSSAEEFYLGDGNTNVPYGQDTGSIGFKYTSSTNQYLYRELGSYAGERLISYKLDIATYNSQTVDRSGTLLVRVFRNNIVEPADDLDIASDPDSVLVDGNIHHFTCSASSHIETLFGTLDLRAFGLNYGDRLYFQITYTNPEGRSFCMDNLAVVIDRGMVCALAVKGSGYAFGVEDGSLDNDALIVQGSYDGSSLAWDQMWRFVPLENGYFGIVNENSGKCADVYGWSTNVGARVVQWSLANGFGANQQWQFSNISDGWYSIVNRNSGLALSVRTNSTEVGTAITQKIYTGSDWQKFRFVPVGHIKVVNRNSKRSMEVYGQSLENGGNVNQWHFWGGPNQMWEFSHVDNGYYAVFNRGSDKAVEVWGSSTNDGANADQWNYWGGDNQQWRLAMDDEGYFQLVNRNSQKALDVVDFAVSNAANVVQATLDDDSSQLWTLTTDDIPEACLMQKYDGNPIFEIKEDDTPLWRQSHVANVAILNPSQTPNGKWMLYCRGSASYGPSENDFHDTIGAFSQDANGFDPFGPWDEYASNPVLSYGDPGDFDERHLLGTVAMRRADGATVVYYKGKDFDGNSALGAAVSTNGFTFEKLPDSIFSGIGPVDAIYHNNQYYLFSGEMIRISEDGVYRWILRQVLRVSDEFDSFTNSPVSEVITTGSVGSYDSKCASAGKIFTVTGDSRWFMIYQTSDKFIDYPDRFHAAYSYDLENWTKVENEFPLMTRGEKGEWDQGGIWTGSIIEYDGSIYIYYEGWGSYNSMVDRDALYYSGGNSRVGVASVSVSDFLEWVDGGSQ